MISVVLHGVILGSCLLSLNKGLLINHVSVADTSKVQQAQNHKVAHAHNCRNHRTAHHEERNPHREEQQNANRRGELATPQAETIGSRLNTLVHDVGEQNQNPHGQRAHHNHENHGEERFLRAVQRQQNSNNHAAGRRPHGASRNASTVHLSQLARRHAVSRQGV